MKTAILGAGAMGSVMGGALAQAGSDVVLIEVAKEIVETDQLRRPDCAGQDR
jgi:ketopantoate reductase